MTSAAVHSSAPRLGDRSEMYSSPTMVPASERWWRATRSIGRARLPLEGVVVGHAVDGEGVPQAWDSA